MNPNQGMMLMFAFLVMVLFVVSHQKFVNNKGAKAR